MHTNLCQNLCRIAYRIPHAKYIPKYAEYAEFRIQHTKQTYASFYAYQYYQMAYLTLFLVTGYYSGVNNFTGPMWCTYT